ncbi:MAG: outer membrane beta-barrel protein [Rickettsiales bacterium]|jgi:opacity protein-like surface antigen|nr:outer membrane beta-barrel protein [Rickettsiales bacterium]
MKEKKLLIGAAVLLSSVGGANATAIAFRPYVSEKISYTSINVENIKMRSVGVVCDDGCGGKDFNEQVLGNRLALGVSTSIEKIKGDIRFELEYGYNAKAKKVVQHVNPNYVAQGWTNDIEVQITSYLFNLYYDYKTGTSFSPYLGVGLGVSNIDVRTKASGNTNPLDFDQTEENNVFTYNVGAGVNYAINDNVLIDVSYRYTKLNTLKVFAEEYDFSSVQEQKADLSSHEISVGAKYQF